jgi:hypothetical protein
MTPLRVLPRYPLDYSVSVIILATNWRRAAPRDHETTSRGGPGITEGQSAEGRS